MIERVVNARYLAMICSMVHSEPGAMSWAITDAGNARLPPGHRSTFGTSSSTYC